MLHIDDFKTQYEHELLQQEVSANKNTLKGFVWFLLAMAFVWFLTMINFFEVDKRLTSITFLTSILLFLPSFGITIKGNLAKPWIKYFLLFMLCVISAVIISALSYHAVLLYVFPLLYAVQYRKKMVIWYAYIINLITITISSVISFYYGICDLNILLQSQHVRNYYLDTITPEALHIPYNENPVFVILVFMIFPRAIILLVFTIMIHYNVINNARDAVRIAQLTYDKNTDSNTNVYNKNKFLEMVDFYYPTLEQISVAFWDLNDLKKINDRQGHAMGDRAVEKLSALLMVESTDTCRIYRIGGDEFVTIIDNPTPNQMGRFVSSMLKQVQIANNTEPYNFSVAVGYATGLGKDILTLLKEADAAMYIHKKQCKEKAKQ